MFVDLVHQNLAVQETDIRKIESLLKIVLIVEVAL